MDDNKKDFPQFEDKLREVEKTSQSLSATKAIVEEIRNEISATSDAVGALASRMDEVGKSVASTEVAISQLGKTNRDAVKSIDNQIQRISEDYDNLYTMQKALKENGSSEAETALIVGVRKEAEDYLKVLEMLREARSKAFVLTSADTLVGGKDTAKTDEQKELYKQVTLAVGEYLQALESLSVMKQSASPEEAQRALAEEEQTYKKLIDTINEYRTATGQALVTAKEMHDFAFTGVTRVDEKGNGTYKEEGDAYSLYDRNLAKEHGEKVVGSPMPPDEEYMKWLEDVYDWIEKIYNGYGKDFEVDASSLDEAKDYLEGINDLIARLNEQKVEISADTTTDKEALEANLKDIEESLALLNRAKEELFEAISAVEKETTQDTTENFSEILSGLNSDSSIDEMTKSLTDGLNLQQEEIEKTTAEYDELAQKIEETFQREAEIRAKYANNKKRSDEIAEATKKEPNSTYFKENNDLANERIALKKELRGLLEEREGYENQMAQLTESGKDHTFVSVNSSEAIAEIARIKDAIIEFQDKAHGVASIDANMVDEKEFMSKVELFDSALENLYNTINELRTANGQAPLAPEQFSNLVPAVDAVSEHISLMLKKYDEMGDKSETTSQRVRSNTNKPVLDDNNTMTYAQLLDQIAQKKRELSEARMEVFSTEDVEGQVARIKQIEDELKKLEQMKKTADGGVGDNPLGNIGGAIGNTINTVGQTLKGAVGKSKGGGGFDIFSIFKNMRSGFKELEPILSIFTKGWSKVGSVLGDIASPVFDKLKSGVSSLGSGMVSLAQGGFSLLQNGAKRVSQGVQTLIGNFKNLGGGSTKKLIKSINGIWSILRRRLKRMLISALFNQAKQGLQELAKYSNEFNKAMSNIKNATKQASGNLSVLFGNVITAVEPILTRIINLISEAITYINAFFALLKGKSTVTVAQKATDDYANSLNKASSAASKALGKFDELNVIGQENNADNGIKYEEQDVGGLLGDSIIEAIKNGNWQEAGVLIGQAFDNLFATIDGKVAEFKGKAEEYATGIAQLLNGLVEGLNFEKAGESVGNVINLITNTLNTFFDNFDFVALGAKVSDAIEGLINSVEWDDLGHLLAQKIVAKWHLIEGIVTNLDWAGLGNSIGELAYGFLTALDFDSLERSVASGVNGIAKAIYQALVVARQSEIGKKIGVALTNLFVDIDWDDLWLYLTGSFDEVLGAVYEALENFDVKLASDKFFNGLNTLIENVSWAKLRGILAFGINDLAQVVYRLVTIPNWTQLASDLFENLKKLVTKDINWDGEGGIVPALSSGINRLIDVFGKLVDSRVFTTIAAKLGIEVSGLLRLVHWDTLAQKISDGIESLSEAFATILTECNIGGENGLASQLGDAVRTLVVDTDFQTVADNIKTGIGVIADAFSTLITSALGETTDKNGKVVNIGTKLADAINGLFLKDGKLDIAYFKKLGQTIGKGFSYVLQNIFTFVKETDWGSAAAGIFTMLSEAIQSAFSIETIEGKTESLGTQLINSISGIFTGADGKVNKESWSKIGESLSDVLSTAFENLGAIIEGKDEARESIFTGVVALINGIKWDELLVKVLNLISKHVKSLADDVPEVVRFLVSAIAEFIGKADWAEIGIALKDAITSLLTLNLNIIKSTWEELIGGYDWDSIGKRLIGAIGKVFITVFNLTPLGQLGSTIFGDDWNNMLRETEQYIDNLTNEWIAGNPMQGVGERIYNHFKGEVGNFSDTNSDMQKGFGTAIALLLNGCEVEYNQALRDFGRRIQNEDYGFGMYIVNGWGISEAIALFSQEVDRSSEESLNQTVRNVQARLEQMGVTFTNEFVESLLGRGQQDIADAFTMLAYGISEDTITALNDGNLHENLVAFMERTGLELEDTMRLLTANSADDILAIANELGIEVGDNLGSSVPEALMKALKEGKKAVKDTAKEIGKEADTSAERADVGKEAGETGTTVTEEVSEKMEDGADKVESATATVIDPVKQKFEELPDDVKPYAETMLNYITTAITEGDGTVLEAVNQMVNDVVDTAKKAMSGEVGAEISKTFLTGIQTGIRDNTSIVTGQVSATLTEFEKLWKNVDFKKFGTFVMESVATGVKGEAETNLYYVMKDVATGIIYILNDYASADDGYMVGYYVMRGLADGLTQNQNAVHNIAYYVAKDLVNTMKGVLKISSPSDVFKDIGGYTMEGLQIGLEGEEGSVLGTISNIASAISDEMKDGAELGYTFDGVTSGLDRVVDSLSDVASQFVAVAQAIQNMGGLTVPAIAEGRTIPYSTRIMESSDGLGEMFNEMTAKMGTINDDQTALLVEQNNLLRSLLEKSFTVNVTPSASWGKHNAQSMQMYNKLTGG